MLSESHRMAEKFAASASIAIRAGNRAKAVKLYRRAATKEWGAFNELPVHAVHTRSALATSVASLWYKARCWQAAEKCIYRFLGDDAFGNTTKTGLKELLEAVLDEQALEKESGRSYTDEGLELRLRGGKIGYGTAPLDALLHVYDGVRSLFYRAAEYIKHVQFRTKGLPSSAIREAMQARTAQPLPGSYRLLVRLTEPAQLEMFEKPFVPPADLSRTLFAFVENVAWGNESAVNRIITNDQYRKTMLKLLRNITPDGKQMREVEFVGLGSLNRSAVLITNDTRYSIRRSLGEEPADTAASENVIGVLRALDLDRRFVDLTVNDSKKRLYANEVLLDDVVGPMVNQRVRLIGIHRQRTHDLFDDIELATE